MTEYLRLLIFIVLVHWNCAKAPRVHYEGEKNQTGQPHGQTYNRVDGDKYVGEWKDGNRHGQGNEQLIDGSLYAGEFKNDKRYGLGTNTWASGE